MAGETIPKSKADEVIREYCFISWAKKGLGTLYRSTNYRSLSRLHKTHSQQHLRVSKIAIITGGEK